MCSMIVFHHLSIRNKSMNKGLIRLCTKICVRYQNPNMKQKYLNIDISGINFLELERISTDMMAMYFSIILVLNS